MVRAHVHQPLRLLLILVISILARVPFFRPRRKWLLLAVAFQATNSVALVVPFLFPDLRIGRRNWTGKLLAVVTSLCWMWRTGMSREQVGLRLPAGTRGWATASVGVLLLVTLSTGERVLAGARLLDAETLAFQARLPGLDEELAYRGLLFTLLWKGFPSIHGRTASAIIVVILFWLAHVVALRDGVVHLGGLKPEVLLASIIFMVVRLPTGSIIVTMAAHSLDDITNVIA